MFSVIWKHNNLSIPFIIDGFSSPTLNNADVNKLVDNPYGLKVFFI